MSSFLIWVIFPLFFLGTFYFCHIHSNFFYRFIIYHFLFGWKMKYCIFDQYFFCQINHITDCAFVCAVIISLSSVLNTDGFPPHLCFSWYFSYNVTPKYFWYSFSFSSAIRFSLSISDSPFVIFSYFTSFFFSCQGFRTGLLFYLLYTRFLISFGWQQLDTDSTFFAKLINFFIKNPFFQVAHVNMTPFADLDIQYNFAVAKFRQMLCNCVRERIN